MVGWLVGCFVGWFVGWLVDLFVRLFVGWLVGWLIDWLVGWLACWLFRWLVCWLVGLLVDLFVRLFIGWSVGWLVGWLFRNLCVKVKYYRKCVHRHASVEMAFWNTEYSTCTCLTTDLSCRNRGEREEWTESQFPALSGRTNLRGGSGEPHAALLGRGGGGSPGLPRAQDGRQKDQQVRS